MIDSAPALSTSMSKQSLSRILWLLFQPGHCEHTQIEADDMLGARLLAAIMEMSHRENNNRNCEALQELLCLITDAERQDMIPALQFTSQLHRVIGRATFECAHESIALHPTQLIVSCLSELFDYSPSTCTKLLAVRQEDLKGQRGVDALCTIAAARLSTMLSSDLGYFQRFMSSFWHLLTRLLLIRLLHDALAA